MGAILIVDDDPRLRQSFEKLLAAEGHTVWTAPDGETALDMVRANSPDAGHHGHPHARHERAGDLQGPPPDRAQAAGDHHDGLRHHRDGHRDHQAGGLRLRAQALRDPRYPGADRQGPGGGAFHALPGRPGHAPGPGVRRMPSSAKANPCRRSTRPSAGWPPPTPRCCIRGESGTGKELVARALYQHSLRIGQALPGHQLRGHPGDPAGERAVRL